MLGFSNADFDINEFYPSEWDYVALGDYHIHKKLTANCAYSGSTDYTSSNFWEEISTPKGYYLFDTDSKQLEFITLNPTRMAIDLPAIQAEGLTAQEVINKLQANASWQAGSMPIVRQTVLGLHPSVRTALSSEVIREIKAKSLHYQLNLLPTKADTTNKSNNNFEALSLEIEWMNYATIYAFSPKVRKEDAIQLGKQLLEESRDVTEQN